MRWFLQAVSFLSFFAISLSGQSAPSIPNELAQNSLIYCTNASDFSFNPQKADAGSNMNVVTEQIYDKLFEFDPSKNQLKPSLAERYEISDDGRTITLFLRKKIAFHHTPWFSPSRDLNAEDVIFSLNRMIGEVKELPNLNQDNQALDSFQAKQIRAYKTLTAHTHFPYFESIGLKEKILQITAPSAYVVKIQLKEADTGLLWYLASQYAVILSKEYALQLNADDNLAQLDRLPVGTGVYQLQSYEPNNYVRLTPNPHYWGKKANIQNMVIDFSTNGTGRMAKFLNHECDISAFPEPSQLSSLKDGYIVSTAGANLAYLAFNMQRPIGENLDLRQKIARSINRERLAQTLFYGVAEVADNILPTAIWTDKNNHSYPYEPTKFSKTSSESDRLTLWVVDEKRVYNLHPRKMAQLIEADLAQIGIRLNIRQVSRAYLIQQLANKQADYDLILSGWLANNNDPTHFLLPILSCKTQNSVTNLANWCNSDFDEWLNQTKLTQEYSHIALFYQLVQNLAEEQLPILPLINVNRLLIAHDNVKNVTINSFGQVNLAEIRLKSDEENQNKTIKEEK